MATAAASNPAPQDKKNFILYLSGNRKVKPLRNEDDLKQYLSHVWDHYFSLPIPENPMNIVDNSHAPKIKIEKFTAPSSINEMTVVQLSIRLVTEFEAKSIWRHIEWNHKEAFYHVFYEKGEPKKEGKRLRLICNCNPQMNRLNKGHGDGKDHDHDHDNDPKNHDHENEISMVFCTKDSSWYLDTEKMEYVEPDKALEHPQDVQDKDLEHSQDEPTI